MITGFVLSTFLACAGAGGPTGPSSRGPDAGAPSGIASVVVQPGVATIEPMRSQRFTAEARDAGGRAVPSSIQWEATGGTIDASGLYVAGPAAGEFEVRARAGGAPAGSAKITIGIASSTGTSGGETPGGGTNEEAVTNPVYLIVGNAAAPNVAERMLVDRLGNRIGAVSVIDDDRLTTSTVSGCRLVVMSKTVQSTTVGTKLKTVGCGVVFWEDNQQRLSMMATVPNDGASGTSWQTSGQTLYVRSDAPLALRAGLSGTLAFYVSGGTITHSPSGDNLPSTAIVIAEMQAGSSRKAIYAYERGTALADGSSAAGRRVYFGLFDDSFDELTSEGRKLFDAATSWAATTASTAPAEPEPAPAPPPPTTSVPNGVAIRPGESIQAYVDRYPGGTTFVIKAGTHRGQSVEPKNGTTFFGEAGAVLDGGGMSRFAFGHYGAGSRDVTIKNLEIRNYMTRITEGAIQGDNTTSWTVEGNNIHHNGGFGIRGGPGMRVLRNHAHHNGDAGIHGYKAHGMLVDGNEVDNNGDLGVQSGALATAAGMKFFQVSNLVVRNNHVHDNGKRGIWTDTDCIDVLIEGNRIVNNGGFGIWHEISYRAVIRNNYIERNGYEGYDGPGWLGGAGIAVTNSPDVEIYGNTLVDNADGIAGMQSSGYVSSGAHGTLVLRNLNVHDNTITMRQGRTGLVQNVSDNAVFTSRNNRFDRNRYHLGSNPAYFAWNNGSRTESQWRGYGQDLNGTFNR